MQSNVSVLTDEADLDIKYGMLNLREERELARASFKYIATDMCDIQRSYIKLGFHLCEAKRCGYYEDFGYDKFEDFVAANFGMDKSALSRCMNVYLKFFAEARNNPVVLPGKRVKNKYEEYSYSQLCEMVSLKDEQLEEIKPDMTIKQIREFKKNCNKPVVDSNVDDDSWFVEQYVSIFSVKAEKLFEICEAEQTLTECAKAIQKYLAPNGYSGDSCLEYDFTFRGFGDGMNFRVGQKKIFMTYSYFALELKKLLENKKDSSGAVSVPVLSDISKDCKDNPVATSQLDKENKKSRYSGFDDNVFIIDLIRQCQKFVSGAGLPIEFSYLNGKSFCFSDFEGNEYKIQFSKSKPKKMDS